MSCPEPFEVDASPFKVKQFWGCIPAPEKQAARLVAERQSGGTLVTYGELLLVFASWGILWYERRCDTFIAQWSGEKITIVLDEVEVTVVTFSGDWPDIVAGGVASGDCPARSAPCCYLVGFGNPVPITGT